MMNRWSLEVGFPLGNNKDDINDFNWHILLDEYRKGFEMDLGEQK